MSDKNVHIDFKKTFETSILNSPNSRLFNSLFVKSVEGKEPTDILENGEYSCAVFVSSILYLMGMIDQPRARVVSLRLFCDESTRWSHVESRTPQLGDIIFWEGILYESGEMHEHVGFAISDTHAVSTSYADKKVTKHPNNHQNKPRKISAIYRYNWN